MPLEGIPQNWQEGFLLASPAILTSETLFREPHRGINSQDAAICPYVKMTLEKVN